MTLCEVEKLINDIKPQYYNYKKNYNKGIASVSGNTSEVDYKLSKFKESIESYRNILFTEEIFDSFNAIRLALFFINDFLVHSVPFEGFQNIFEISFKVIENEFEKLKKLVEP